MNSNTMVKLQEASVASLMESFKSLQTSEGDGHLSKQKSLVIQAFKSLKADCPLICFTPCSSTHEENLPALFQQIELRTELLNRLRSGLLPSLRHRITALSLSLDPSDLRKDTAGKLKQVLEILSELEQTMNQVKASIDSIAPVLRPSAVRDDRHLKNLKAFRCGQIRLKVNDLANLLSQLFESCVTFIENLGDSSSSEPRGRAEVLSLTSMLWDLIDSTIEWFDRSEFSLLQDHWQSEVGLIDDALDEFLDLINRTGPEGGNESANDSSNEYDEDELFGANDDPPSEQVIQLARSTVPLIKLSRMFLAKLSKATTKKEQSNLLTEMSSSQLQSLLECTRSISLRVDEMVSTLSDPSDDQACMADFLIESGQNLSESFGQVQVFLDDHIIPLISEDNQSTSSKVNPQTWFSEWNKQFLLAYQNYIQDVNVFRLSSS